MKKYNIAVLGGDGIGPEVTAQAVRVLTATGKKHNINFNFEYYPVGGASYDLHGEPLTDENFNMIRSSDAVLLGAVGGQKWDNIEKSKRPEQALFKLRGGMELFANLRPIILFPELIDACPLKPEIVGEGLDILIVRELTGGIYFGEKKTDGDRAYDIMSYTAGEVDRIIDVAISAARKRRGKLTLVDKANVLETSRLWRKIYLEKTAKTPDITADCYLVDNAAMQLIRRPSQFDVMVTENLFGDILSDEASMLTGSIGMLPSASLGSGTLGMYEPVHGSAPDIAGKGIANPIASIMSAAMLLRYSLNETEAADNIENAVKAALKCGSRTADIARNNEAVLSTSQMCDSVIANL